MLAPVAGVRPGVARDRVAFVRRGGSRTSGRARAEAPARQQLRRWSRWAAGHRARAVVRDDAGGPVGVGATAGRGAIGAYRRRLRWRRPACRAAAWVLEKPRVIGALVAAAVARGSRGSGDRAVVCADGEGVRRRRGAGQARREPQPNQSAVSARPSSSVVTGS